MSSRLAFEDHVGGAVADRAPALERAGGEVEVGHELVHGHLEPGQSRNLGLEDIGPVLGREVVAQPAQAGGLAVERIQVGAGDRPAGKPSRFSKEIGSSGRDWPPQWLDVPPKKRSRSDAKPESSG
jgi:hypothetical protein